MLENWIKPEVKLLNKRILTTFVNFVIRGTFICVFERDPKGPARLNTEFWVSGCGWRVLLVGTGRVSDGYEAITKSAHRRVVRRSAAVPTILIEDRRGESA